MDLKENRFLKTKLDETKKQITMKEDTKGRWQLVSHGRAGNLQQHLETKGGVNEENERGRGSCTNNVPLGAFNTEPRRPHNNGVNKARPRLRVARFLSGWFQ